MRNKHPRHFSAMLFNKCMAVFFMSFLFFESLIGQGFSFREYYSPEEYGAHFQNWVAIQDTNGFIHFGNGGGLLTFNGVNWEIIHIGNSGRGVSLFLSKEGKVYASGNSDFGYLDRDSVSSLTYKSISKDFYSSDERVPPQFETYEWNNSIYYRHPFGINKYDGANLKRFEDKNKRFGKSVKAGDSLLIGSDEGIVSFNLAKENGFKLVKGSSVFAGELIRIAKKLPGNKIIFGGWEQLLVVYDGSTFTPFQTEVDNYLKEHKIYDLEVISDSLYAIATLSGGIVFIDHTGKLIKMFTDKSGLITNQVYDLFYDDEQILWIGFQKGVQKLLLDQNIEIYNEKNGLTDVVIGMAIGKNEILAKTIFGLFKGETIVPEHTIQFTELGTSENISSVFSWNGEIYGLSSNSLFRYTKSETPEKLIEKGDHLVRVNTLNEKREIFFVSHDKLIRFDGVRTEINTIADVGYPIKVLMKGDSLFALSSDAVHLIKGQQKKLITLKNEPTYPINYNDIGFINEKIFIGIEGNENPFSLYKYDGKEKLFVSDHFLSKFEDFKGKQVLKFQQCSDSEIWFNANKKLLRLYKENNSWLADNSSYRLLQDIRLGKSVFTINCAEDGTWFGGTSGLAYLKDSELHYNANFQTNITGIYIDRDSLIYGGYGEPKNPIILPYKDNELRFSYAAASYISPEDNIYQVKLAGFDETWNTWTFETQKDYTNIPEGEYTFQVKSKNVYNVAGVMDSISFEILPPWYRAWWAYLLYTFIITGFLYLAYKIRINQLLRVQRIRNNIASDLHDEVSATLSSISYFAEAIKSDSLKKDKTRFVDLIADSAGDAKEKISDIVWAINPEHDDWPAFLSKCRRFASDLLESKEMEYSLKIDEFIPGKLDMQFRQHLWLIYKEMITNAVRHSEAKTLNVILKNQEGVLKLIVQDDGEGMDIDKVKKGNGLVNIQKRADLINAEVSLKTSEGFGTRWMLNAPL